MAMNIYKSESLFYNDRLPTDLKSFSSQILSAVYIKKLEQGKGFSYIIENMGDYIINQKLYLSLLLLLSRTSQKITIKNINEKIFIKAENCRFFECEKEIRKLGGIFLKEIKKGNICVILTASKTDKKVIENKKDWCEITNPLSVINCYLEN